MINMEASRISSDDKVIYTDKTPKSLFEYYLNHYTEKDVQTIVENLKMDFETWDKTYNFYKTSKTIEQLSSDAISIVYEDASGNCFIYSFATKKIYPYVSNEEPYVIADNALTIKEFLEFSKRDFEALLRTPYGKKYVTEASVVTEGIKEFFGYGKAYRIYLSDMKTKPTNPVTDEHTLACAEPVYTYFKGEPITRKQFSQLADRKIWTLETYENKKLGGRDAFRCMPAKKEALIESEDHLSLHQIYKKVGQQTDNIFIILSRVWDLRKVNKNLPELKKYVAKYKGLEKSLNGIFEIADVDKHRQALYIYAAMGNAFQFCSINTASFYRGMVGKYANTGVSTVFIASEFVHCLETVINILVKGQPKYGWVAEWHLRCTKEDFFADPRYVTGNIELFYGGFGRHYVNFEPSLPPEEKNTKRKFGLAGNKLYEYLVGVPEDVHLQDIIKERYSVIDYDYSETQYNPAILEELIKEDAITPELLESVLTVVTERSTTRDWAHKLRDGIEAVAKTANAAKRAAATVVGPITQKIGKALDELDESRSNSVREAIITDSTAAKLSRLFKESLGVTALAYFAFGPTKAIITYLVTRFFKTDDEKERKIIIRELETELKLTREKIEDAKSDNDRSKKYELMRIESKLEDELARVKYKS